MIPAFTELFGSPPQVTAFAPGRVNLIGDYTDYNEGFVLPTVTPQTTRVELSRTQGAVVDVVNATMSEESTYSLGHERRRGAWLDYVQGLTRVLRESGHVLDGFALRVESDVPMGVGLASGAALEIGVLRALRRAFDLPLDDMDLALLAHTAETQHVRASVGVMDHIACSLGRDGYALFLDTRTLARESVPLPDSLNLLVIDPRLPHRGTDSRHDRRRECRQAAVELGVSSLRDADLPLLRRARLPAPLNRRARHVVTEDARVLDMIAALLGGDIDAITGTMAASHASLRDDFEISAPDGDDLVRVTAADEAVHGARMTSDGAVVAFVDAGAGAAAGRRITAAYEESTGRRSQVLVPPAPALVPPAAAA